MWDLNLEIFYNKILVWIEFKFFWNFNDKILPKLENC